MTRTDPPQQRVWIPAHATGIHTSSIRRNDSSRHLVSDDDHKRDESIIDEVTYWVSPTRGLVKIQQHYRQYTPVGTLEKSVLTELEVTAFEFQESR